MVLAIGLLLLQACSFRGNNQMIAAMAQSQPEQLLVKLKEQSPYLRDLPVHLLNVGSLEFSTGDFKAAIQTLSQAKELIVASEAVSISENIGSVSVNETIRTYTGTPSDKVTVHTLLALSYLFANDIYGARVEILQADVTAQRLAEKHEIAGQLVSLNMIGGIIFEQLKEYDSALVSYRKALQICRARRYAVSDALKYALIRLNQKQGYQDELKKYLAEFGLKDAPQPSNYLVQMIYLDGLVSYKVENRITVPFNGQIISVTMPEYRSAKTNSRFATLETDLAQTKSQVIEDFNLLAREDFALERPAILSAAIARATTSAITVNQLNQQNPLAAALFNIVAVAKEIADVRSWVSLPATMQLAVLPAKANKIKVISKNFVQNKELERKGSHIILVLSNNKQIFGYPAFKSEPLILEQEKDKP